MFELKIISFIIITLYQVFTVPVVVQDPEIEDPVAQQDLNMALPDVVPLDNQAPAIQPLFISISANGTVHINRGKAKEALDADPAKRDLLLLKKRLGPYTTAAKAVGQEPIVQLHADKNTKQQRVIDVLNTLAGAGITKVTFTDLVDAK